MKVPATLLLLFVAAAKCDDRDDSDANFVAEDLRSVSHSFTPM
jgi:hypothetical protein